MPIYRVTYMLPGARKPQLWANVDAHDSQEAFHAVRTQLLAKHPGAQIRVARRHPWETDAQLAKEDDE
jgi:hypothetical protein